MPVEGLYFVNLKVEGAFIQSLSSWIMEEIKYNKQTGELLTDRTWNYKIFGAKDIPHDFRVYLLRRAFNPVGILGSKGNFFLFKITFQLYSTIGWKHCWKSIGQSFLKKVPLIKSI